MTEPSTQLPIAVIGGGLTGLTAAFTLARQGRVVRLFESSDRLGGVIRSERSGEWLIEAGPNSMQVSGTSVSDLLRESGIESNRRDAQPAAKNRFILRGGKPQPVPLSPPALIGSPLFSLGGKFRLFGDLFQRPRQRPADVSVAEFGRDHFGQEFVDYALGPFVSGVYAGNPDKLSARHSFPSLWEAERTTGSVIRGQIAAAKARRAAGGRSGPPPIISFDDGLEVLPRALAAALPSGSVELQARVESLVPGSTWQVIWTRDGETRTEQFDRVVLALPAAALSRLPIGPLGERPMACLESVEYPPIASLFLGFRREQVQHPLDGFGLLIPTVEKKSALGVLFSSTLFSRRAPEGHIGLTVLAGGATRPDLGRLPTAELLPRVLADLKTMLGVSGEPVFLRHNAWARAIPQYNLGHERYLELIERCESAYAGLLIGGQVRDGISLPNCIDAGRRLAARALA